MKLNQLLHHAPSAKFDEIPLSNLGYETNGMTERQNGWSTFHAVRTNNSRCLHSVTYVTLIHLLKKRDKWGGGGRRPMSTFHTLTMNFLMKFTKWQWHSFHGLSSVWSKIYYVDIICNHSKYRPLYEQENDTKQCSQHFTLRSSVLYVSRLGAGRRSSQCHSMWRIKNPEDFR
jgi:hypothetical protein